MIKKSPIAKSFNSAMGLFYIVKSCMMGGGI